MTRHEYACMGAVYGLLVSMLVALLTANVLPIIIALAVGAVLAIGPNAAIHGETK